MERREAKGRENGFSPEPTVKDPEQDWRIRGCANLSLCQTD